MKLFTFLVGILMFSGIVQANDTYTCMVTLEGTEMPLTYTSNTWSDGSATVDMHDVPEHEDEYIKLTITPDGKAILTADYITVTTPALQPGDVLGLDHAIEWGGRFADRVECRRDGIAEISVTAQSMSCSGKAVELPSEIGGFVKVQSLPEKSSSVLNPQSIDFTEDTTVRFDSFTPGLYIVESDIEDGHKLDINTAGYFDKHEDLRVIVSGRTGNSFNFRRNDLDASPYTDIAGTNIDYNCKFQ